jgi:D-alanyl-lipoteichoic acid acyltransferase DltB (MBOAT superfamily)
MLFNSYPFVFGFMPVVLAVFYLLSTRGRAGAAAKFIIAASLFFYGWWNWRYLALFGFSVAFNFSWAQLLGPVPGLSGEGPITRARRRLLRFGIAVNIALLGYFKYRNFFILSAGAIAGTAFHPSPLILPLAVSFFTFEQITYLTSAFRGEPGTDDFLSYCMFITFFPHLIAGPIVRYADIFPQFNRSTPMRLRADNLSDGLMVFAMGLFKKVLIADTFRTMVGPVFDSATSIAFADGWGAAIAFALQIYFDFSGYSDMAIGLARIFGVRFPENFDSPYQARNIIEFWRRWHITLSFFLRDYLYIPLGGNRRGELRRYVNLAITMILGGLWHGANWTFVVWGALHATFLCANHLWVAGKRTMPASIAWPLTFFLTTIAWVFFRAPDFARAAIMIRAMTGLGGFAFMSQTWSVGWHDFRLIAGGLAIVLFLPNRQTILSRDWKNDFLYAAAFALMAASSLIQMSNPPAFIYFQF